MRFGVLLITALGIGMQDGTFHSLHPDMDLANDYVHTVVTSRKSVAEIKSTLRKALQFNLSEEINISEDQIDEVITDDLERWRSVFDDREITHEEYKEEIKRSSSRRLVRMELIEAEYGVYIFDMMGACEVLAALLGNPTKSFNESINSVNQDFRRHLNHISSRHDTDQLTELVPLAEQAVVKLMNDNVIKILGLQEEKDKKGWIDSMSELLEKLELSRRSTER